MPKSRYKTTKEKIPTSIDSSEILLRVKASNLGSWMTSLSARLMLYYHHTNEDDGR